MKDTPVFQVIPVFEGEINANPWSVEEFPHQLFLFMNPPGDMGWKHSNTTLFEIRHICPVSRNSRTGSYLQFASESKMVEMCMGEDRF